MYAAKPLKYLASAVCIAGEPNSIEKRIRLLYGVWLPVSTCRVAQRGKTHDEEAIPAQLGAWILKRRPQVCPSRTHIVDRNGPCTEQQMAVRSCERPYQSSPRKLPDTD